MPLLVCECCHFFLSPPYTWLFVKCLLESRNREKGWEYRVIWDADFLKWIPGMSPPRQNQIKPRLPFRWHPNDRSKEQLVLLSSCVPKHRRRQLSSATVSSPKERGRKKAPGARCFVIRTVVDLWHKYPSRLHLPVGKFMSKAWVTQQLPIWCAWLQYEPGTDHLTSSMWRHSARSLSEGLLFLCSSLLYFTFFTLVPLSPTRRFFRNLFIFGCLLCEEW